MGTWCPGVRGLGMERGSLQDAHGEVGGPARDEGGVCDDIVELPARDSSDFRNGRLDEQC